MVLSRNRSLVFRDEQIFLSSHIFNNAGGGRGYNYCWFHMTSLKFELQNYRSYRDFFHDILEQLKTNIHTNVKSITFMFMSSSRDKFMLL